MEEEAEFTTRRNFLVPSKQYKLMLFKVCCIPQLTFSLYQIYTDKIIFIDEKAEILSQVYTNSTCIPGGAACSLSLCHAHLHHLPLLEEFNCAVEGC